MLTVGLPAAREWAPQIGKGQQGIVVGAIDLLTGEEVAIKKVVGRCVHFRRRDYEEFRRRRRY
jgi:hypothetical protein